VIQEIVSGLEAGSWYALVGIAIVVVMKATDVPNFAMAEMGLCGAYVAYTLTQHGMPFTFAVLIAIAFGIVLGVIVDVVLMRHLSGLGHFPLLLMTIGLSLAIDAVIALVWGSTGHQFNSPWTGRYVHWAGQVLSLAQIICVGVGLVIAVIVSRGFASGVGAQMRAVAENRLVARVLGVNVRGVSAAAWGIGTAIAVIAMILQTQDTALTPESGQSIIIYAFVAATLGGFSSFMGTVAGGLALGVLQNLAGSWFSTSGQSAIALAVVLLMLLLRPVGFANALRIREV
jgi:branched-chain amino acid transport system permease protein